jgi:hypothetical protein
VKVKRVGGQRQKILDKLEYACELIELLNAKERPPMRVVEEALTILEFGQLTPKEFLSYIKASGR